MRIPALVLLGGLSSSACGGSQPPAETSVSGATEPESASGGDEASEGADAAGTASEAQEEVAGLPEKCVDQHGTCVPSQKFVDKLCQDVHREVALVMFEKGSPWTRGYMRARTEARYASGGVSGEGHLAPGEEVIILRVRKLPEGGMQVSGAGGWDVLRWDGTCATISTGEMGLDPFGQLANARVEFKYLDEPTKEALRENEAVTDAYRNRRQHCKGASMGAVTKECEKWDAKLVEAVVAAVRGGIELPTPEKLPE